MYRSLCELSSHQDRASTWLGSEGLRTADQESVCGIVTVACKFCPKCRETKAAQEFSTRGRLNDKLGAYCKPCQREYAKQHYLTHLDRYKKKKVRDSRRYSQERARQFVTAYLAEHPCVDCQLANILVLEFDHVRGLKVANISEMACKGLSIKRIQAEISKCEVRCANCHRRRTYLERWQNSKIRSGGSSAW